MYDVKVFKLPKKVLIRFRFQNLLHRINILERKLSGKTKHPFMHVRFMIS